MTSASSFSDASFGKATLYAMGLQPLTWDEVLLQVESRLGKPQLEIFRRYHRSFIAYPTPATLQRFYDFCYSHRLHDLLASYRFDRLARVLETLNLLVKPGLRLLEVGAGGGFLLGFLKSEKAPCALSAYDLAPKAGELWSGLDLQSMQPDSLYDGVIFADCLGEIHNEAESDMAGQYGFAEKLEVWRSHLAPDGFMLLLEPIAQIQVWQDLANTLTAHSWLVNGPITSTPALCLELKIAQASP
jgi:hypothetical protein